MYKYIPKSYLHRYLDTGSIMLSNPVYFHDELALGNAVGDNQESVRIKTLNAGFDENTPEPQRQEVLATGFHIPPAGTATFARYVFHDCESRTTYEDYYIWCAADICSGHLMDEFDADRCIEVVNEELLARTISRHLGHDFRFLGWWPCIYEGNSLSHNHKSLSIPPVVFKRPKYRYQQEVRAIWQFTGMRAMPYRRAIVDPELTGCFELVPMYRCRLNEIGGSIPGVLGGD